MRRNFPIIKSLRWLVLAIAMLVGTGAVSADSRSDARTHYQTGVKLYNSADYRGAIREFSAAQQLLPADLNNYNLALCYDKLGEAEPAIQYYKSYLDKVPATDKRAEIEASVSRLDAASKSVAAKQAEAQRQADAARLADEQRKADEARQAQAVKDAEVQREAAQKLEDARSAEAARQAADPHVVTAPGTNAQPAGPTPGIAPASTGDPQLDRVSSIDISGVRDQRIGAPASGWPADQAQAPASANAGVAAGGNIGAVPPPSGPQGGVAQAAPPTTNPQARGPAGVTGQGAPEQPKEKPVYKKWWFWAVVAVSAYVVISIATDNSKSTATGRMMPLPPIGPQGPAAGGFTLLSF